MISEMAVEMDCSDRNIYEKEPTFEERLDEACQYIDYNVVRSLPYQGELKPIIIYKNMEDEKWYDVETLEEFDFKLIDFLLYANY